MKLKGVLIVLLILLALLPAWYVNHWLQKVVRPRRSFAQFLLYLLLAFAFVFGYTFLLTAALLKLFPPPHR